jgi:hypothetical protein
MEKCSNKWDHVFMYIHQKRMLKPTYIFLQEHKSIDFENKIFLDYTYQSCANVLKEFQVKLNVPFTYVKLIMKFYIH